MIFSKEITLMFSLSAILAPALAEESFKIDMSYIDVVESYDVLNIGKLAVGEVGLLSTWGFSVCNENGNLKISSLSELDPSPSEYGYAYEVTRNPNNSVSVVFSSKGKIPDEEGVQSSAMGISRAPDCEEYKKEKIPLFSITTFLGANSLKNIVPKVGAAEMKSQDAIKEKVLTSNVKDDWTVRESKSPIDDSPKVTLYKNGESGDQTLVLRCNENTTNAYISTSDYLGDESVNVTIRYDSNKAEDQKLSLSTDNKALFFSPSITSIKKMMASDMLVIRYQAYNGTTSTASFDVSNLKENIKPLRLACNW